MNSRRKNIMLIVIFLLITASSVMWFLNYKIHFNGFLWNDSHDYNQIARNIYNGDGFKTSTLRPINLLNFQKLPHPEVSRPPIYPHLLACFFMLFGVNDFAVVLVDGIFYVLLVALSFWAAMELSGSYKVAFFTAASIALAEYSLKMSIIGSSDIFYAGLFMVFLLLYLKKPQERFWQGVVIGILYLSRSNTVFFAIPWLFIEFNPREPMTKLRDFLKFTAGAFMIITPYLIRNYIETGNPIFSLHKYSLVLQTETYPSWTVWIQLKDISAWNFIFNHPYEIINKIINSAKALYFDFSRVFYPLVTLVLLSSLVLPIGKDNKIIKIRKLILWTVIVQTAATLPVGPEARFYLYLFPVIFILFAMMVRELLKSVERKELLLSLILVALFISITYTSVSYLQGEKKLNLYPYVGEKLKTFTKADDVIASDIAWEISWYGDRKTVWLPYDIETLNKISESIPINYVFLSLKLSRLPLASYKDNIWQKFLFFEIDPLKASGFKLIDVIFYGNAPVGVLYRVEKNFKNQEIL